jgi:Coenzyme PQQ synthesis protein D (PqqD)
MTEANTAMTDLVLKPVADIKVESIDGELLLYHPRQTKAIYLNPTAAVIWSLCDGQRRVGEIIQLIGECYPESKGNLEEDVFTTLQELRDNGVLRTVS